ncbi:MFS transporter [Pseudonocardia kujensis]|uniref:MFS transporter n=1 Tax=Pseudonocardia kujensis TaxID=1128675 RepID=UPI001E5E0E4E|nr:MFS transporter [Pseudonocardia kujensis]MCE0764973.1 MFS transporter [Pseudonocardia kujensis]
MSRRAAIAGAAGTTVEYYDYSVFAYLAVTLVPIFLPTHGFGSGILTILAIYGAGFAARPLGGIVFGVLGDRLGRRKIMLVTVSMTGVATLAVGLLPTYQAIGPAAPILLTALRLIQGFAAGGEAPGSATYVAESAPDAKRGFHGSATNIGISLGLGLAATSVGVVIGLCSAEQMASWGWRIPFLLALPLLLATLYYRLKIEDSPLFQEMLAGRRRAKAPIAVVLTHHRAAFLKVFGVTFGWSIASLGVGAYTVVHYGTLGYKLSATIWIGVLMALVLIPFTLLSGALSDRFGRRRLLFAGFIGSLVLSLPCFLLMQQGSFALALVAGVVFNIPAGVVMGASFAAYTEQFPTEVRLTGVSLGFNLASVLGTSQVNFVAGWLVATTGSTLGPAYYAMAGAVVALIATATIREGARESLRPATAANESRQPDAEDGLGDPVAG